MSNEIYEVPKLHQNHLQVKLLYITKSKYDKDWHSTNHTHHFTELIYIIGGKGTFIVFNEEVHVKQNDLIIVNPNVEHTEKSSFDHPLEYIALGIQGFAFFPPDNSNSPVSIYNFGQEKEMYYFYLNSLIEEMENQQENSEIIVQNILEILLLKMLRKKAFTLEKISTKKISKDVAFIKSFINQHYPEDINLDTLAEAGHLNKYYLAHSFKKSVGVSPIEYLIQTRIGAGKILLETTNYPISQISAFTGFSSQSLFAQSFKRVTNISPSQYRKSNSPQKITSENIITNPRKIKT